MGMAEMTQTAGETVLFPDNIRFQGTLRPAQKRVIDGIVAKSETQRRVCVVAAPGCGRHGIGLETIRRLGEPALIMSPSTQTADDWKDCFTKEYLPEGEDAKKWVSRDASVKAPLISVTYQALHAVLNSKKPLANWLKTAKIGTVLLDDPHHLRPEYWKVVEEIRKDVPSAVFVTLFSADPEDSNALERDRIFRICGGVEDRITAPELVREGTVVPYQDYVYLCRPEGERAEKMAEWENLRSYYADYLAHDKGFASLMQANLNLENVRAFSDVFRDHPKYFLTLMSCLKENGLPLPDPMPELLAGVTLPKMDADAVELLLEGYLDFDKDAYNGTDEYRKVLIETLKESGLYSKNKLDFRHQTETEKLYAAGADKFPVIKKVLETEKATLGADFKALILTESIKKELSSVIGNAEKELNDIGTVTVFEYLRREAPELRLGAITSTFVAVPADTVALLEEQLKFTKRELPVEEYVQLQFSSTALKEGYALVEKLLADGQIDVIVSTHQMAADTLRCPAYNTVIFADSPGTSAQFSLIRGMAMQKDEACANKSVHFWHLLMVDEDGRSEEKNKFLRFSDSWMAPSLGYGAGGDAGRVGSASAKEGASHGNAGSASAKEGASHGDAGKVLCMGSERFAEIGGMPSSYSLFGEKPELGEKAMTAQEIKGWNEEMLRLASDRHALWTDWNSAMKGRRSLEKIEMVEVSQEVFKKTQEEKDTDKKIYLSAAGIVLILVEYFVTGLLKSLVGPWIAALLYGIALFGLGILFYQNIQGRKDRFGKKDRILRMAQTVLEALQDHGEIVDDTVEINMEELSETHFKFNLVGGTTEERTVFADTLAEAFGPVVSQLCIVEEKMEDGTSVYYPSPEIFNDEIGENNDFFRNLDMYYGGVIMGYTGGRLGRELMLKARFETAKNPLKRTVIRSRFLG